MPAAWCFSLPRPYDPASFCSHGTTHSLQGSSTTRLLCLSSAWQPERRVGRRALWVTCARGSSPYEPLERAIQAVNRALTVAERAGWGSDQGGSNRSSRPPPPERWVQFGASTSAQLSVDEGAGSSSGGSTGGPAGAAGEGAGAGGGQGRPAAGRTLEDYLGLPVDQYSLLDPKWIERQGGGSFKLTVPLGELLGVDLTPEIHVQVYTNPETGKVTLVGSKAALGAPQVDSAFKLRMIAVLAQHGGQRRPRLARFGTGTTAQHQQQQQGEEEKEEEGQGEQQQRWRQGEEVCKAVAGSGAGGGEGGAAGGPLSRLRQRLRRPSHIPGRPVYRLRKLVARARGREFLPPLASNEWDSPYAAQLAADRMLSWGEDEWGSATGAGATQPPPPPLPLAAAAAAGQPAVSSEAGASGIAATPPATGREGAGPAATSAGSSSSSSSSVAGTHPQQPASSSSRSGGSDSSLLELWPEPQPGEHVYCSYDDSDEDFYGVPQRSQHAEQQAQQQGRGARGGSLPLAVAEGAGEAGLVTAAVQAGPAQLACCVSVDVALRVPQAIRVVPNALLGHTGRLLLKAVLSAVLPNFLELLASDYKRWASGERDPDGGVGDLFLEGNEALGVK